jgi:cytochrome P450
MTQNKKYPPGPINWCGLFGLTWRHAFMYWWDPLNFSTELNEYGDLVFLRVFTKHSYHVNHPDLIHDVLVTKKNCFVKQPRQMRVLRQLFGDGLLTSSGELWLKQRRMLQQVMHPDHLSRFADMTVLLTREWFKDKSQGCEIDVVDDMADLISSITVESMFGLEPSEEAARLSLATRVVAEAMTREIRSMFTLPDWLPLKTKQRKRWAIQTLNGFADKAIHQRRRESTPTDDLLSRLLLAVDNEGDGQGMSNEQARYEAITMLVAGQHTTAASLSWLWLLVSNHLDVREQLIDEAACLETDELTFSDLEKLPYTEMVIKETLRIYPTAWALFSREAIEDVELGGYTLRKGSWVHIYPWVIQRDPQFFPDPLKFDPERFAPGRIESMHPHAYFPFGMGPHVCIGARLAMVQMKLIVASVLRQFRVTPAPNQKPLVVEPHVAIRPEGSVNVCLTPLNVTAPFIP